MRHNVKRSAMGQYKDGFQQPPLDALARKLARESPTVADALRGLVQASVLQYSKSVSPHDEYSLLVGALCAMIDELDPHQTQTQKRDHHDDDSDPGWEGAPVVRRDLPAP